MRAPLKVRRVQLVRIDDPTYLEEMSRQAVAHRRLGPRQDPGDLYRASSVVETAVRAWLGVRLPLLDERVIDADVLPTGERAYVRRFQELDAVVGRSGIPECVVEMKFSASGGAVRRGLAQLGRARAVLRHRWPDVSGLLILVEANRTGVELDLDRVRDVSMIDARALDRPPAMRSTALLVLNVEALSDHLDASTRRLIERGHDEGDALTAARLARAAMIDAEREAGDGAGSRTAGEETGHDTSRSSAVDRSAVYSATFGTDEDAGDADDESPFAALAGLRLSDPDDAEI